jgi:hypothetical protein
MREVPMRTIGVVVIALLLGGVLSGCSGGTKAPRGKRASGDAEASLDLPAIDPLTTITVDDGRISVSSPEGWSRAPRSNDCLVRYMPGSKGGYPTISVIGTDAPRDMSVISEEGHEAFVEAVAEELERTYVHKGKSTLLRKAKAVTVGPHLAVAWMAPGRATVDGMKQTIERDCVALVIDGRMYTVEARAPKGKLDAAGKAAARAVAANLAAAKTEAAAIPSDAAPADAPAADAPDPKEAAPAADAAPADGAKPADDA